MHQKKLPSHRVIKKPTRKRNIIVPTTKAINLLDSYNRQIFKEKKIKTVRKQTERVYSTQYPCYITLRNVLKMRKNSQSSLVDVKASFATTGKVYPLNRPKKRSG
jgi:hypothetical protein